MSSILSDYLTTQPGKAIWLTLAIAFNFFRLPIWLLLYTLPFLRPSPKWTYIQALRVRLIRAVVYNIALTRVQTPASLSPGPEKNRYIIAPPAPSASYIGPAVPTHKTFPVPVGGTWYPAPPPPPSESAAYDTVVLHFHGGAYAVGSGRTDDCGFFARTILRHTPATRVYAPQYRLVSAPTSAAFPAQLQDAVTALTYLVRTCELPPSRIVLSGDSAGGNLALALLRYLAEYGDAVGLPGDLKAALLWSPWVDPVSTFRPGGALRDNPHYKTDYLTDGFGRWGALGLGSLESEYVSFFGRAFAVRAPVYVSVGECETLFDQAVRFVGEMRAVKGNRVEFSVEENAVHDIILTGDKVGFEKEAERAAKRAGEWLDGL